MTGPCRAAALLVPLLLAACAQTSGGQDQPFENSATDAQRQYNDARGREAVRAPSQLQISLPERSTARKREQQELAQATLPNDSLPPTVLTTGADAPVDPQPLSNEGSPWLRDVQTYFGTVPCFTGANDCAAQRVTLTLSPNGRWRSRTVVVDPPSAAPQPQVSQGCWRASGDQLDRIALFNDDRSQVIASFSFSHGNALVLRQLHDQGSSLTYRLARQPDIDPVAELGSSAPACAAP